MKTIYWLSPALLACAAAAATETGSPQENRFREVSLSRGENAPIDRRALQGLVLPAGSFFEVDPAYVSRHDIVYLSPNLEPFEGFPMGNGDLGGMIWTTDEGVTVQVNKSNSYDQERDIFHLKSLGRLNIRFNAPCFEWVQLDDFEGRLSLHDATARYRAATPYMKTKVEAITCADRNVWMVTCEAELLNSVLDTLSVSVDFERYGSRRLEVFVSRHPPGPVESIGQATTVVRGRDLVTTETFTDMNFAVAVRVLGAKVAPRMLNSRRGSLEFEMASRQEVTVLVSAVTSDEAADPASAAVALLDGIPADRVAAVKQAHAGWWNGFWGRSFVHLDDDYLENLYHMRRYMMAAGSRAHYPVVYNAGIWTWNHDVRNWFTLMGWNQLNTYVGLDPQNDCDLMLPYLDLYWRLMPYMEAKAEERFQLADSLLLGEPHDVRGMSRSNPGPGGHSFNFTAAPHIARFFLMQYEFTQDLDFLRDHAYPFALKAGNTYLEYLKWDDANGRYTIDPAKPYECATPILFHDTITDLAMLRHLFPKLIKYSILLGEDADKREQWRHVLDHLWDPPVVEEEAFGTIFSEAYKPDGSAWPRAGDKTPRRFQFSAGSALAFPGDLIDLDDKGTGDFEILSNFLDMHYDYKNIISHDPIVAARMGDTKNLMRLFRNTTEQLQHYPQGLMYNMDSHQNDNRERWEGYDTKNPDLRMVADYMYDRRAVNRSGNRRVGTVQIGMEPQGIQAAAVNEMLLQSHDGKVRVFPATPKEWESAFILRASGGFMVSSEKQKNREPGHVFVLSASGNGFRLVNPWETASVAVESRSGETVPCVVKDGIVSFSTKAGESYLITPENSRPERSHYESRPNKAAKHRGYTIIGKDRDFNRIEKIDN